ncbi:MAG: FeoB-associated Cys-rich membrane protein [Peptococcaceae bacterium]|nr:FeoB-associated Cys-rich membrane protein [Peptococcaceae bacterium]
MPTLGTLVTSVILILALVFVIRYMVRQHKNGASCGCGDGCKGCSCASGAGSCACNTSQNSKL